MIQISGTYLTDTPVCELVASGMMPGAGLTLGGLVSPRRVSTLDNVFNYGYVRSFPKSSKTSKILCKITINIWFAQ